MKNLCELLLLCLWVVAFFLENAILSDHHANLLKGADLINSALGNLDIRLLFKHPFKV